MIRVTANESGRKHKARVPALRRWGAALAGGAMIASAPAWALGVQAPSAEAQLAPAYLPGNMYLLSPAQLSHIRGKFVDPSNGAIVFFGVTLSSDWSAGRSGDGVRAHLTFGFSRDQTGNFGHVSIDRGIQGDLPSYSDPGGTHKVQGSAPVEHMDQGLGQSIQVAGNGNDVHNTLNISSGTSNNNTPPDNPANLGASWTMTQSCGTSSNCQAVLSRVGTRFMLSISSDRGTVHQEITPGQLLQSAQVTSDLNHITNTLKLQIQRSSSTVPVVNTGGLNRILHTLGAVR